MNMYRFFYVIIMLVCSIAWAQKLHTPINEFNHALIYNIEDHEKLKFASDALNDFFKSLESSEDKETPKDQSFDAIRLYRVPEFPNYVYFWSCKNIKGDEYAKPQMSSNCSPLVYKYEEGEVSFYFDYNFVREHEHVKKVLMAPFQEQPNLAAFDINSLVRTEKDMRRAHSIEKGTTLALGVTASLIAGVFVAELLILPLTEHAAISFLARAAHSGGSYKVWLGSLISSYTGDILMGVYGFAFIEEAMTLGKLEQEIRDSIIENSNANLGHSFSVQGDLNSNILQPIVGTVADYETALIKLLNADINYALSGGHYMIYTSPLQKPYEGIKLFNLDLHDSSSRTYKQEVEHWEHCKKLAQDRKCEYLEKYALPGSGRVEK